MMRYRDIPQYTRSAAYGVDVDWHYLEKHLDGYAQYPNGLDLDPDFQRAHVWTEEQQRAYVEHILRGGWASRTILFNCHNWNGGGDCGTVVLVDGKQRLEAVRKFLRGDLPIFGGNRRSDFTDRLPSFHASFRVCVNDLPTRAAVSDSGDGGCYHDEDGATEQA